MMIMYPVSIKQLMEKETPEVHRHLTTMYNQISWIDLPRVRIVSLMIANADHIGYSGCYRLYLSHEVIPLGGRLRGREGG